MKSTRQRFGKKVETHANLIRMLHPNRLLLFVRKTFPLFAIGKYKQ